MSNDHLKIGSKSYAFAWGEKAGKKVVLFLCKDANDTNWKVGMASLECARFLADTLRKNMKILWKNADHCFWKFKHADEMLVSAGFRNPDWRQDDGSIRLTLNALLAENWEVEIRLPAVGEEPIRHWDLYWVFLNEFLLTEGDW